MVDTLNDMVFDMLPGETISFYSADSIADTGDEEESEQLALNYPVEFLNTLDINGIPHHCLKLKIGVSVMLLRNLNPSEGLCNGTRIILTGLHENVLRGRVMSKGFSSQEVLIPRINLIADEGKEWPFRLRRRQFPVRVAFAMTIHKSQGQTLKHVGVYLPEPVFTHGQLYTAFSRVTSPDTLHVLLHNGRVPGYDGLWTPNVVHKEVLV
ncbi:hypothetical protein AeNC1_017706 [Aphanomyces euteiches]|nr:hypothetical protein AeNC1_017706 [Aphanomyces euteiches]